jgi:hypothetical protein
MIKTVNLMQERIFSCKHPFRQSVSGQAKPQKNRYERRKIRGCLHPNDWADKAGDELSTTL